MGDLCRKGGCGVDGVGRVTVQVVQHAGLGLSDRQTESGSNCTAPRAPRHVALQQVLGAGLTPFDAVGDNVITVVGESIHKKSVDWISPRRRMQLELVPSWRWYSR